MKICVFGATGPVGQSVVKQALGAGHEVTAVTRNPDTCTLRGPGLSVVGADVADASSVEAAINGSDAVISTFGAMPSRGPITSYSVGVANMLQALSNLGLRRIVCVSSKELDEEGTSDEPPLYRFVFARLLAWVNKSIYDDMRRMETLLRASDREWTIIRPGGLFAADHVTDYRYPTKHESGVSTSTADLADALIREATENLNIAETMQVHTDTGKPAYLVLLAKQASLHRR